MAVKRQTIYNLVSSATAFNTTAASVAPAAAAGTTIPVTLSFCRRMEIKETYAAGGSQSQQGLQYQLWRSETKDWGPTIQADPGETIYVGDPIPEGAARGSHLGLCAQATYQSSAPVSAGGASTRAADTPIRIISASAATPVIVTEYQ